MDMVTEALFGLSKAIRRDELRLEPLPLGLFGLLWPKGLWVLDGAEQCLGSQREFRENREVWQRLVAGDYVSLCTVFHLGSF